MHPPLIICMGVSGAGKSTCGRSLAEKLELQFIDADDLHPAQNIEKMGAGVALTDSDRKPWMTAVCRELCLTAASHRGGVIAHSGLRRAHRAAMRSCGLRTLFLHLEASRDTLVQRLENRNSHFMPASLLDSQLSDLQSTRLETDVVSLNAALGFNDLMFHALSVSEQFISGELDHALGIAR